MTAATIQIQSVGAITGVYGSLDLNQPFTVAAPLGFVTSHSIGTNSAVPIPSGSTTMTIVPPTNNTSVLTLKGVAGDTGFPISKTQPSQIGLDPTATTFTLNSGTGSVTVVIVFN